MTTRDQEELDSLLEELVDRAEKNGSTLSTFELRGLHQREDLQALRFHRRYWDASTSSMVGVSFSVSAVTYKAALIIGEDPNSFITDEHFVMVRRLWAFCDMRKLRCSRTIELAPYMALLLGNPEHEQLLTSLIADRDITAVDELREILEGAKTIPVTMAEGVL